MAKCIATEQHTMNLKTDSEKTNFGKGNSEETGSGETVLGKKRSGRDSSPDGKTSDRLRKVIPELNCLLSDVEKAYGRRIQTTTDFEALSVVIERETRSLLSSSTLKRLWGYVSGTLTPRKSTLDILCNFIGRRDFASYCRELREDKTVTSRFFSSKVIESESLTEGTFIVLGWAPDRLVRLEYLGGCEFVVRESENSKLSPGDRFSVGSLMLGFPLYIPALHRASDPGTPVSYVAGAVSGLNRLDIR